MQMNSEETGAITGNTDSAARSRRDVLKTGATLVPVMMTLYAAPAWAQTDYTQTAYRYGANAGLCRNPNFDPNSSAPWKRDEFMPCEEIRRGGNKTAETLPDEPTGQTGDGTKDILSF